MRSIPKREHASTGITLHDLAINDFVYKHLPKKPTWQANRSRDTTPHTKYTMKEGPSYSRLVRSITAGKLQSCNRQPVSLSPVEPTTEA